MKPALCGDIASVLVSGGVIRLRGELDVASVRELTAALSEVVGDRDARPVADLTEVTCLDSPALGALVHAAERMRRQGRRLTLRVSEGAVTELLEHTRLSDRFEIARAA